MSMDLYSYCKLYIYLCIEMQHLVQASITFMGHGWYSVFCDLGCTRGLTGCALLSESLQVISYVTVSEKRQFHKMNAVHRVARGNFTHRRNGNSLKLFMVQALSGHQLVGAVHHINISKSNGKCRVLVQNNINALVQHKYITHVYFFHL